MKDNIRKDLEKLCHSILANDDDDALATQLTQVQMLYERLLVLNYLSQQKEAAASPDQKQEAAPETAIKTEGQSSREFEEQTPPAPKEPGPSSPAPSAPAESDTEKPAAAPAQEAKKPAPKPRPHFRESGPKQEGATAPRKDSLNDRLARGTIEVGLNDRLAFVKHLFNGQQEDFNRVLSQLNTAGSYSEAADFLENLVKPDYDWTEKEEYEERLLHLVRQKFGEEETDD